MISLLNFEYELLARRLRIEAGRSQLCLSY